MCVAIMTHNVAESPHPGIAFAYSAPLPGLTKIQPTPAVLIARWRQTRHMHLAFVHLLFSVIPPPLPYSWNQRIGFRSCACPLSGSVNGISRMAKLL
jgi:hypothetical protein